jgi:hypothetical protein
MRRLFVLAVGLWADLQVWCTRRDQWWNGRHAAAKVSAEEVKRLLAKGKPEGVTDEGWEHFKVTLDKWQDSVV